MDSNAATPPFGDDFDPYGTLAVQASAKPSEIKSAYKKLALKHHPGTV